uniref:Uncharacterized protein n=1 Tax=Phlebotomus papatasi TaxID=29031 RepID=A0A1B0D3S4_PHLPP
MTVRVAQKRQFYFFFMENFFKIIVKFPEYPLAGKVKLEVYDLSKKIPLEFPPDDGESAQDYVRRLEMHLEGNFCDDSSETDDIMSGVARFEEMFNQLDFLEKSGNVVEMSSDCTKIRMSGMSGNEQHFLEFAVSDRAQVKVTDHSLPALPGEMFWKIGTIESHMASFQSFLGQLVEFYDNMHTIDELCFVVGPPEITTKTTHRIIKFSEKIFLKISIDPLIPSQISLNFIGPIAKVEPLREIYNEKIADWDSEMDVHKNLLRMYDMIYFPMKENDVETPCNICFDYLQGSSIPIISCDNTKCNVIFHLQCLKNYFVTLRSSKTMFTLAMGQCPFCREKLTTFLQLEADENN